MKINHTPLDVYNVFNLGNYRTGNNEFSFTWDFTSTVVFIDYTEFQEMLSLSYSKGNASAKTRK